MKSTSQLGLSLVELLIALVIGSLLLLTGVQISINNKDTYLFLKAQTDNQGNGRFTLQWLDRQLARAGYKRRPDQTLEAAFPALSEAQSATSGCAFAAGQVLRPLTANSLCIRYQPSDRHDTDCLGNGRAANASALAQPYSEPVEAIIEKLTLNTNQQLLCTSKGSTATLVEGIADIRFDYGISPAGSQLVSHYNQLPASDETIRSVRYTALLSTPLPTGTNGPTSRAWRYWNARATPAANNLYQVIKGTTSLRNLSP